MQYKSKYTGVEIDSILDKASASNDITIVENVNDLDPNAQLGSLASVVEPRGIKQVKASELPLPNASILDPDTGFIDVSSCPKVQSISISEQLSSNFFGYEMLLEFISDNLNWFGGTTGSVLGIYPIDLNASGEEWGGLGYFYYNAETQENIETDLCTFIYADGVYTTNFNQEALTKLNSVISGMYYVGSTYIFDGDSISQDDFSVYDTVLSIIAEIPGTASIYFKQENWNPFTKDIQNNINELYRGMDNVWNQTDELWQELYRKANDVTIVTGANNYIYPYNYYKRTIKSGGSYKFTLENNSSTYLREYMIEITCTYTPGSVEFKYYDNTSIRWVNDTAPEFEAGYTYVISIAQGLGVFAKFTNS